jgi:hypothetical protein
MGTHATSVHTLSADGNARIHVGNNVYGTESRCLADLRITDPRLDKKRIEQTKGGLLAEVYRWILDNADFRRWRHDRESRLLWIKGDPGKGKAMLFCGIVNELETSNAGKLAYFFCQGTDARINIAVAVLRGLLYMLVDRQPSRLLHVQKKYDLAGKQLFEDANAWVALSEIFGRCLARLESDPDILAHRCPRQMHDGPGQALGVDRFKIGGPHIKWVVSSWNRGVSGTGWAENTAESRVERRISVCRR